MDYTKCIHLAHTRAHVGELQGFEKRLGRKWSWEQHTSYQQGTTVHFGQRAEKRQGSPLLWSSSRPYRHPWVRRFEEHYMYGRPRDQLAPRCRCLRSWWFAGRMKQKGKEKKEMPSWVSVFVVRSEIITWQLIIISDNNNLVQGFVHAFIIWQLIFLSCFHFFFCPWSIFFPNQTKNLRRSYSHTHPVTLGDLRWLGVLDRCPSQPNVLLLGGERRTHFHRPPAVFHQLNGALANRWAALVVLQLHIIWIKRREEVSKLKCIIGFLLCTSICSYRLVQFALLFWPLLHCFVAEVSAVELEHCPGPRLQRFRTGQITNKIKLINTYCKNGANQSVKSNPRLRIEAGWYVADRIRIRIEPPHAFDCRKRAKRNRIRNLKSLAVQNSENTCRLSGSSTRNRTRNLQSVEPLYY